MGKPVKGAEAKQAGAASASGWQKQLLMAWMAYCKVTPREERDIAKFQGAIPDTLRSNGEAEASSSNGKGKKRKHAPEADAAEEGQGKSLKKKKRKRADS